MKVSDKFGILAASIQDTNLESWQLVCEHPIRVKRQELIRSLSACRMKQRQNSTGMVFKPFWDIIHLKFVSYMSCSCWFLTLPSTTNHTSPSLLCCLTSSIVSIKTDKIARIWMDITYRCALCGCFWVSRFWKPSWFKGWEIRKSLSHHSSIRYKV